MTIKLSMRDGDTREFHDVTKLCHIGRMIMISIGDSSFESILAEDITQIHTFHLGEDNGQERILTMVRI